MSWASISSNQTISFTNLKDACATGQFTEIVTITNSNEQVTAADVGTYTDAIVASGITATQLPVKSDLISVEFNFGDDGGSSGTACGESASSVAYANVAVPVFGTVFYSNSTLTTIFPMSGYSGLFIKFKVLSASTYTKARFDLGTSTINNGPQAC
jgi:glycine cleavage system H lipoate-binding protein